jgi:hypothetical protein
MSVSFSCLLLFVSLFLALVRCLAVAIEMLRLNVCWNHIEGVEVWYVPYGTVSPYVSDVSCLQMAFTPCCSLFLLGYRPYVKAKETARNLAELGTHSGTRGAYGQTG